MALQDLGKRDPSRLDRTTLFKIGKCDSEEELQFQIDARSISHVLVGCGKERPCSDRLKVFLNGKAIQNNVAFGNSTYRSRFHLVHRVRPHRKGPTPVLYALRLCASSPKNQDASQSGNSSATVLNADDLQQQSVLVERIVMLEDV